MASNKDVITGEKRDTGIAYVIWFFLGFAGGHKFYLEKIGMGLLYFFTGGLLGIGWFIDMFTLPMQVRRFNEKRQLNVLNGPSKNYAPSITNPNDIEKIILKIAQKNNGVVTPMDIAVDSPVTLDNAKAELEKMVQKGYADMEVKETGVIAYRLLGF